MKIALIGYGKMGHIIEQVALRGHEIVAKIDVNVPSDKVQGNKEEDLLASADVAIEFTAPGCSEANILKAWAAGIPIVVGTTGWDVEAFKQAHAEELKTKGLMWTSNYSVGVNILFAVNQYLARLLQAYPAYKPSIVETHHIHKLDAPSGTAKTLAEQINQAQGDNTDVPIESIREGEVPGIHTIIWESEADTITLSHSAKSREGFALGAVLGAEYMVGKTGFHNFNVQRDNV